MPYVLVVQSDADLARQIGDTLKEAGYELSTEAEGAWARRSLLVRPPDGIVLATGLNDGSGFQVAEAVRQDADTRGVPIFFVANKYRGQAHRTEARRRFFPAEYLSLPLDMNSLLAVVLQKLPPRAPVESTAAPLPRADRLADAAQRRERREVEEVARDITSGRAEIPEMRGSLGLEPFARLFRRLYVERRTGALLLAQDNVKKIVHFQDGYPVSVRSNVLGECLGQILLQQKLISRRALDESLRRMKEERKQQGQLLVEMGALSPYNLTRALIAQMEAKLVELFAWRVGTFTFTEGKEVQGQPIRPEKAPAALIREGIRKHYDLERQRAVLAPFAGQYVVPSHDPLRRLQEITTDPAERRFIEALDGSRRIENLLENAPIALGEARLLLVAMAEAGMIEPSRTPSKKVIADATHPTIEDWEPTFDRTPERKSREELQAILEAMRARTHFEVLGVEEDTTTGEIDRAYNLRARDFHPDRFRSRPEDLRQLAVKIFDRLGEAQLTLRDLPRRKRYVARLERDKDGGRGGAFTAPSSAAEKMYFAGVDHLRAGRHREAVETFRQTIALAPTQASYRGALGWAIFRAAPADSTAIEEGLGELQRAVQMDPKDPWIRISLGRFFAETGWPEQAVSEFEEALQINPGLSDLQEEIRRLKGEG